MLVQLPNGLIDGMDHFGFADVDELRGKQQNYLVDRELVVGNIGHVPKILGDVVKSLQTKEGLVWKGNMADAIAKLPSGDIELLLIKIRENTYGPRYYFEAECPHCEHMNKNLRLDLNSLELKTFPVEEMIKPKVLLLPKMKVEVELKPLYLRDLFEVIKITSNKKATLITSLATVSLKRIGDNTKVTEQAVADIPASDLAWLREEIQNTTLEGSVDSDVETTCKNCQKDFKSKLNVYDPSFFDHTRASTTTNT